MEDLDLFRSAGTRTTLQNRAFANTVAGAVQYGADVAFRTGHDPGGNGSYEICRPPSGRVAPAVLVRQGAAARVFSSMSMSQCTSDGLSNGRRLKLLCLLWLAGAGTRLVILAAPPVIPLIHDELHPSEAQIGLLISLPLVLFAAAAVPGSLLASRFGARLTLVAGMLIGALGAGGRGAAVDIWTLYAATIVMGFGISIMQPALPSLVREWLPHRTSLGMVVSTNGMVVGVAAAPALTIPFVLPYLDNSWRLTFVFWAMPLLATALMFFLLSPENPARQPTRSQQPTRWWPDWKSRRTWLLGIAFGSNNSIFYGINAFVPDYLASLGRPDLIGHALAWCNGSQLIASVALLLAPAGFQVRRWPYLIFGPITLAALVGLVSFGPLGVVIGAGLTGFSTAVTFCAILALPALLSAPEDVHRTAAGTFTISYSLAVIMPTVSGAIWDHSGQPWLTFTPLILCAVTLTTFCLWLISSARRPTE